MPGDGTTSHLATSFLDGLVSKQWTEATTVWSENGSSSLKFGSLSKISYDFDHRRSPAGQISWFWPSSLTLQFFFCFEKPYILAILIDGFVCLLLLQYQANKVPRIWKQMEVETVEASPALAAHLQTSPVRTCRAINPA